MKLKKHLRLLFSLLLMSVFLLTGCSPEAEDLAADVLTAIAESEYTEEAGEITQEDTELPVLESTDSGYEDSGMETSSDTGEDVGTKTSDDTAPADDTANTQKDVVIAQNSTYTSKDDVAAYLHEYGHLPSNFITKKEAKKLGWVSSEGNLGEVAPGMSIGGDYFGNYEGNLPEADGRDYYECDIDSDGSYRGAKRIVFSNDGLIYYTEDHYETFELLYGEE